MFYPEDNGDLPAKIEYYDDGTKRWEFWYKNGEWHRDGDLPAKIGYNEDGTKSYENWYKNGEDYTP